VTGADTGRSRLAAPVITGEVDGLVDPTEVASAPGSVVSAVLGAVDELGDPESLAQPDASRSAAAARVRNRCRLIGRR
jgi:hypothetical protein